MFGTDICYFICLISSRPISGMSGTSETPDSKTTLFLFDKMNCFQLLPRSLQDFSKQLYPKLMFLGITGMSGTSTHSRPFGAQTHLSVALLSLFNKMNWFQLGLRSFGRDFSSQFYLKAPCSGEIRVCSSAANHVMCSHLQNTFQSWHHRGWDHTGRVTPP